MIENKTDLKEFIKEEFNSYFISKQDSRPDEIGYKTGDDGFKRLYDGFNILTDIIKANTLNPQLFPLIQATLKTELPIVNNSVYSNYQKRESMIIRHEDLLESLKKCPYQPGEYVVGIPALDAFGEIRSWKYALYYEDTRELIDINNNILTIEQKKKAFKVKNRGLMMDIGRALKDDLENIYEEDYRKELEIWKNILTIEED